MKKLILLLLLRKKHSGSFAGSSMCSNLFFWIREYWAFLMFCVCVCVQDLCL